MKEENQNVKEREIAEDQIDFRALLFKYIIHWPWFIGAVLLCFVGAWFYLHWATPIYNISATVLIKDEKKGGGAGLSSVLLWAASSAATVAAFWVSGQLARRWG